MLGGYVEDPERLGLGLGFTCSSSVTFFTTRAPIVENAGPSSLASVLIFGTWSRLFYGGTLW